jgi:O-antigen/teichoic acid export membrane protein
MTETNIDSHQSLSPKPDRISINTIWVFIGQAGTAALSFATIFLLTRYLGPERFGQFSTAASLGYLLIPLAELGFDLHMTRTIAAEIEKEPTAELIAAQVSETFSLRLMFCAFIYLVMIASAMAMGYSSSIVIYVALMGLAITVLSLSQSFMGAIRAIRLMRYESISYLIGRSLTLGLVLIFVLLKADLISLIASYLAGSLVMFALGYYFLKKQISRFGASAGLKLQFSREKIVARIKDALPFGLTAVFTAVYMRLDVIIISKINGTEAVGLYTAAQNFVFGSMMLAVPITVAVYPALASMYRTRRDDTHYVVEQGLTMLLLIGLAIGLISALMSHEIVLMVFGEKYILSALFMFLMAAKIPLVYASLIIGNSMGAVGFQNKVALATGIGMVFNAIANATFIPIHGPAAAAIVMVITELLILIILSFASQKIFQLHMTWPLIKIAVCAGISVSAFFVIKYLAGPWVAGASFCAIYVMMIFALKILSLEMFLSLMRNR